MSDKFEKNSPAYIANLWSEYKKIKGYQAGGPVDSDGYATTSPEQAAANKEYIMKEAAKNKTDNPGTAATYDPADQAEAEASLLNLPASPNEMSKGIKKHFNDGGKIKKYNEGSDGPIRKSSAQRENEDIQVLDAKTGKVKKTIPKYKSTPNEEPSPSPEESPSPSPSPSPSDTDYSDTSKPLGKRMKAYQNAIDEESTEDIPSYAMGGTADNQQPNNQPMVMDIPRKMDDGGQVQPSPSPQPEKTHNEKIVDILHRVTDPNQNSINQRSIGNFFQDEPGYADGGTVDSSFGQLPGTSINLPQQAAIAKNLNIGQDITQGQQMAAMPANPSSNSSSSGSISKPKSKPKSNPGYTPVQDSTSGSTNILSGGPGAAPLAPPSISPGGDQYAGSDPLVGSSTMNTGSTQNSYKGGKIKKPKMRHYADGSGGLVEPDKFVDTQSPQEEAQAAQDVDNTGYAQEDYDAQKAAENSTQGQIEQELTGGPKDEASDEPVVEVDRKPASKDDEDQGDNREHREVILPEDTIRSAEDLADVDPQDRTIASDTDTAANIPPAGRSAQEQAQVQGAPSSVMDQLKSAQRKQNMISALQGIGEGASLVGAGLAGRGGEKVTPVNPAIFRDANVAALPMQHFAQQMQMDKEDPNSPISKTYQDHIIAGLGSQATPQQIANIRGSSANNLDKFLPQQTKLIYGQNAIQAKKDMLTTRLDASKELAANKQDFTSKQNDLNRADRDKIAAMAQEGMKQRFDTPTLDRITNEVRNDPLVKPVILKKASVDESLNLLDNAKTVHPALLSDANFAFTQAMNLQPGATTQKRYDASKITDLNQRVHAWVANNLNSPNADMKQDDPELYNLLHGYLSSVSDDYGNLIDSTQGTVLNTKKAAYQALGRPGIVGGINAMQGALGNGGKGPSTQQKNGPAGQQQTTPPTITVRRKADGKTKTLAADAAAKYLSDPGYEKVQ